MNFFQVLKVWLKFKICLIRDVASTKPIVRWIFVLWLITAVWVVKLHPRWHLSHFCLISFTRSDFPHWAELKQHYVTLTATCDFVKRNLTMLVIMLQITVIFYRERVLWFSLWCPTTALSVCSLLFSGAVTNVLLLLQLQSAGSPHVAFRNLWSCVLVQLLRVCQIVSEFCCCNVVKPEQSQPAAACKVQQLGSAALLTAVTVMVTMSSMCL